MLSVDERVAALIDAGSALEIGGAARSQQAEVAPATPRDGVVTAFGRIAASDALVIADDCEVLSRTDGEVARLKRHRALTMGVFNKLPIVLLVDGPQREPPLFDTNTGQLAGKMFDPRLDVDLGERDRPLVSVVFGSHLGWAQDLIADSEVVIATSGCVASLGDDRSVIDVVADDDASAIAAARAVLGVLASTVPATVAARFVDGPPPVEDTGADDVELAGDPGRVIELLVDTRSFVDFGRDPGSGLWSGLARIGAWPVVIAVTGGVESAVLSGRDLRRLARLYRLAARCGLPIVLVQDCAGYSEDALRDTAALALLSRSIRDCTSPAITIVTGRGHTLGTFGLGSKQLGTAFIIAWPWARLATTDSGRYSPEALERTRDPDPWLAAGRGLVDDVLTPAETARTVRRLVALFSQRWRPMPRPARPNSVNR